MTVVSVGAQGLVTYKPARGRCGSVPLVRFLRYWETVAGPMPAPAPPPEHGPPAAANPLITEEIDFREFATPEPPPDPKASGAGAPSAPSRSRSPLGASSENGAGIDPEVEDSVQDDEPVPALEKARASLTPRTGGTRATTLQPRFTRDERRAAELIVYPDVERPRTRGDCEGGARPCPFVSCAHHLYLDVNPSTGAIKLNFPHLDVWEMRETCALDIADRDGATLEQVGEFLNVTRERVRQIEELGVKRARRYGLVVGQDDLEGEDAPASLGEQLARAG